MKLAEMVRLLEREYGRGRSVAPSEPFELLMWEYVAYLADDADRKSAFDLLKTRIGIRPGQVAAAPFRALEGVCRAGGAIAVKLRAQRMHDVAVRVRDQFDGNLGGVLALPYPEARRILKSFPAIGPPGADQILLLSRARPVLALDSNALRVLLRLGYGQEKKSYSASYAGAQEAAMAGLRQTIPHLQKASRLLRRHGQELCRRTAPRCPVCPLQDVCPSTDPGVISARRNS